MHTGRYNAVQRLDLTGGPFNADGFAEKRGFCSSVSLHATALLKLYSFILIAILAAALAWPDNDHQRGVLRTLCSCCVDTTTTTCTPGGIAIVIG